MVAVNANVLLYLVTYVNQVIITHLSIQKWWVELSCYSRVIQRCFWLRRVHSSCWCCWHAVVIGNSAECSGDISHLVNDIWVHGDRRQRCIIPTGTVFVWRGNLRGLMSDYRRQRHKRSVDQHCGLELGRVLGVRVLHRYVLDDGRVRRRRRRSKAVVSRHCQLFSHHLRHHHAAVNARPRRNTGGWRRGWTDSGTGCRRSPSSCVRQIHRRWTGAVEYQLPLVEVS